MQQIVDLARLLQVGLKQKRLDAGQIGMTKEVTKTSQSVEKKKRPFGQGGRAYARNGLGHALK